MGEADELGQPPAGVAPVAVIGLGCRFAGGADSPGAFWTMLVNGTDGIGELPPERWQPYAGLGGDYAAALRRATRLGAFLSGIDGFDAEFFGLSPREAELMDPQQRLLLEVSWEALEHSGVPPHELAGSDTGVFVGIGSDDYGRRLLEDLPNIEAWTGIGAAMCAAANRISYALDLRGPSLAVDTACSASLVAVHLACQSLRAGDASLALAAGVNLIISPGLTLTLDAAGAMAPDGRCKSFDASANGYGRGEGCGVLVLRPLAEARRRGDRILAVIVGSAVNQDGRTNGIMAPSQPAQEHVLRRAYEQAGIPPSSVGYVEAHGTGTRLGDPLEAGALSAVHGVGRDQERPCLIGSVKANIGHLEAGAGAASMIKAVLALHHEELPPSLNFSAGTPAIDWPSSGLRVVCERTPWPRGPAPRRAGVSGFGYGGTIAHVVLEETPGESCPPAVEPTGRLFPLSANSQAALRQSAARLADWIADPGPDAGPDPGPPLASIGHTLALRRTHLPHRAAVLASDPEQLTAQLRALAADEDAPGIVTGTAAASGEGLVWVFSGHGSQWAGMGRGLLTSEPAFAAVIDALGPIFAEEIGFVPRQVLMDGDLGAVDRIQTMIFAMQVGLAEVWRHYGVRPDAVIGHSVGEIAASVVAGALTLEAGARLSCRRSKLLRRVAGKGAMAMVALPFDDVAARLAGRPDAVPAIWSSPVSTVIAGDPPAIEEMLARWQAEDIPTRRVASDVAFHSPHMDDLLTDLIEAVDDLDAVAPRVRCYSTALSDPRAGRLVTSDYWAANLRNPVRLAAAVQAAVQDGYRAFLEISAHPVVAHSIGETLAEAGQRDAFVGSTLRRDRDEQECLLASLGAAHCGGIRLDWTRLQPGGDLITLPRVAWQHRRYWRDSTPAAGGLAHDPDSHALIGTLVSVAGQPLRLWRTLLDDSRRPYPGSHTINGVEITPAAVLLATFRRAASAGGNACPVLADVELRLPLGLHEQREVQVQLDGASLRLASRPTDGDGDGTWLTHACAALADSAPCLPEHLAAPAAGLAEADPGDIRAHLAAVGVPTMAFAWTVEQLHRGEGSLRARVRAEQSANAAAGACPSWAPLLDAALSVAPVAYPGPPVLRMVAGADQVYLEGEPPAAAIIDVCPEPGLPDAVRVLIACPEGRVVGRLTGVRCGVLGSIAKPVAAPEHLVHEIVWSPLPVSAPVAGADTGSVVFVGPGAELIQALCASMSTAGVRARSVSDPESLDRLGAEPDGPVDVVVVPAAGPLGEAAVAASWLLTRTAQRLASLPARARLWCLTTGVRESGYLSCLAGAPLWGLGRVLAGEHPDLWGGTIDLDVDDPAGAADLLLTVLRTVAGEEVIALRDGHASVARLSRVAARAAGESVRCRADGTYLITGGLGVLGRECARWLAGRGARRVVLATRQPFPPRQAWDEVTDEATRQRIRDVRELEALGVTVRVLSLDIADADQAARLLTPDSLGLPPIRGVVHAAGVLDDRLVSAVDEDSLRAVMRPKVEGALVLHHLFPPGSLDFLVLFSSCGQLLGLPGQASYASANAFLDALATHRVAAGCQGTTSFGWTSWRGQGMSVNAVVEAELAARGVSDISADEAFSAWDFAVRHGNGYRAVLRTAGTATQSLPLLSELPPPEAADIAPAGTAGPADRATFADLPADELLERLMDEVGTQVAGEMRLGAQDLDPRRSLVEQGLDSVMTILIRRRLERRFGLELPTTLMWHRPSVAAIADHLASLLSAP